MSFDCLSKELEPDFVSIHLCYSDADFHGHSLRLAAEDVDFFCLWTAVVLERIVIEWEVASSKSFFLEIPNSAVVNYVKQVLTTDDVTSEEEEQKPIYSPEDCAFHCIPCTKVGCPEYVFSSMDLLLEMCSYWR